MEVLPNLLVVNFVMDSGNSLLSHQAEAVVELSRKFNHITVITGKLGDFTELPNVDVISTDWVYGKNLGNVTRLYLRSLPIILRGDFKSVFFHMTDLQCALLSPFIRLRNRKQYLWYAHAHKSNYLKFASIWVNKIITSTFGSCPVKSSKVVAIGQAIDETKFSLISTDNLNLNKLVHIGRFDKSKKIDVLINSAKNLRFSNPKVSLTIIGTPGNDESIKWSSEIIANFSREVEEGWLKFQPAISRSDFAKVLAENGCFFHAYIGSLDKTLIESTMCGAPVVTLNPEYLEIFNSWANSNQINLESEYISMRKMSEQELEIEINRRRKIALNMHSLNHWIHSLTKELLG